MKYMFTTMIAACVLAFSSMTSAVTVIPDLVLDFGYNGLNGGTLDGTSGDFASGNIVIDTLTVEGVTNDSFAVTNGQLTFSTGTAGNEITITGEVAGLTLAPNTVLFTGLFTDWSFFAAPGEVFMGSGLGGASDDLLLAIGESVDTPFSFFGFSLESTNDNVLSTDFIATASEPRTPEVPIPAAVWLFGSGLLGMVGVARRKVS